MFYQLSKEEVLKAAQATFQDVYIEYDEMDFYIPDLDFGILRIEGIDKDFFVSTHYAYEDRLVNENQTRYKVPLSIVYTKHDPFEIMYDTHAICYVAYKEEGEIKFILYTKFYDFIKPYFTKFEKTEPKQ